MPFIAGKIRPSIDRDYFDKLSHLFNRLPTRVAQGLFYQLLDPSDDLHQIGQRAGLFANKSGSAMGRHFRRDWCPREPGLGYWPGEPVEERLRAALVRALGLSLLTQNARSLRKRRLPIRFAFQVGAAQGFTVQIVRTAEGIDFRMRAPVPTLPHRPKRTRA
jgi:hypothetical protein